MSHDAARPVSCENCGTTLEGDYCHACGQAAHSPVRSFAHAIEEVFESFWHLDGKIFRTLRDLTVPGRVASAYLAGKRVPYVAPMRLFVVLAVLTFFIARLAVHAEAGSEAGAIISASSAGGAARHFGHARTPDEVEAIRETMTGELRRSRDSLPAGTEGVRKGLDAGIRGIDRAADQRLLQLSSDASAGDSGSTGDGNAMTPTSALTPNDRPWDPVSNPLVLPWLPDFANRWINVRIGRAEANLPRLRDNPQLLYNAYFAAVPSTLFVMVPLFALMLKLLYLGSGRLYLEHLVVALSSHAFLCLDLLAILLLMLLGDALSGAGLWASLPLGLAQTALWLWMPVYLLLMQRRVYRQSWPVTLLKYGVLGGIYGVSVFMLAIALLIFSFTNF